MESYFGLLVGGRGFEGLVNSVAKRFACLLDLDR